MMLVERGLLHLNMPVHLFLGPAWKKHQMRVLEQPAAGADPAAYPEFEPCSKSVTVQMLLTHTSGITYGFDGTELVNPVAGMYQQAFGSLANGFKSPEQAYEDGGNGGNFRCASLQEFTDRVAAQPLCFQPGSRWHCKFDSVLRRGLSVRPRACSKYRCDLYTIVPEVAVSFASSI